MKTMLGGADVTSGSNPSPKMMDRTIGTSGSGPCPWAVTKNEKWTKYVPVFLSIIPIPIPRRAMP
jgi:hypothetical protein